MNVSIAGLRTDGTPYKNSKLVLGNVPCNLPATTTFWHRFPLARSAVPSPVRTLSAHFAAEIPFFSPVHSLRSSFSIRYTNSTLIVEVQLRADGKVVNLVTGL